MYSHFSFRYLALALLGCASIFIVSLRQARAEKDAKKKAAITCEQAGADFARQGEYTGHVTDEDVEVPKSTTAAPLKEGPDPGPIYLQNHGHPLRFRNIWVVKK